MRPLDAFLEQCCAEIERRAEVHEATTPVLTAGAQAFRSALADATSIAGPLVTMPVVEQLHTLAPSPLVSALLPALGSFPWAENPALGDNGTQVALGRIDEALDFGDVTCGLMLIGSGCAYPLHHHPPQELYLPIAGNASWRFGGSTEFRHLEVDELPYNNPNDVHSVRAGDEPLVAMFVLWPGGS